MAKNKVWKINQFYGGFALDDKLGLKQQFADTSRNLDIYTEPGKLRPHKLMVDDETGALDAAISDFWAASDSKIYAIGKVGADGADKAYARLYVKASASVADWTTAASGTGGAIGQTRLWEYKDKLYFWGKDDTIYSYGLLSGTPAIDEAVNTISAATDFTGPMIEQKDTLFVSYDNHLASFDGTTWTDDAFDLPTGWKIISLATWGKYVAIGATNSGGYSKISKMFFWDTSATSWEFAKDLPYGELMGFRNVGDRITGISFIDSFHASERIGISIWEWTGGTVNVVHRHNKVGASIVSADRIKDSEIDVKDNVFYFAANLKGTYRGLYSWGEPIPGQKAFTFDRHLRTTTSTVSLVRAVKFIGPFLFCSLVDSSSGTDYIITKTTNTINHGTATADGGIYDTLIFDGGEEYRTKEIDRIILNSKQLPTNTSITLSMKTDRASSWTTVGTWTTATDTQKSFYDMNGSTFDKFKELQLRINIKTTATSSGTPEITGITTLYRELSIPND